jgi:SsrA-binding protein
MSNNTPSIKNRRARHDYEILESFEAGIELKGTEVKSIRQGQMQLKDSYIDVSHGQLYLANAHIEPYKQGNRFNHEPERRRRLLMHKHEIIRLGSKVAEKGLTLIPLKIYFTRGKVKVQVGLCKGKNVVDKRHTLKEKEAKREVARALKDANRE